jgi:hypothetical protein
MLDALVPNFLFQVRPFFDQMPPPGFLQQVNPPLFCLCPNRNYHLAPPGPPTVGNAPAGVGGDVMPNVGPVPPSRIFRWLPYVAGRITYVPVNNDIVMTGKMSGCWLTIFSMNGQRYFGHLGTDSNNRGVTEDVKSAWKIAVNRGLVQPVRAFDPAANLPDCSTKLAAIDANGTFYGIACDEPGLAGFLKVKRVVLVPGVQQPQFL